MRYYESMIVYLPECSLQDPHWLMMTAAVMMERGDSTEAGLA